MNIYIHIYTYLYSNIYFIPRNKIKSNHRPCFLFSKTRERFRSRAHRNNRNSRWVSRALVNRHEINSRKERCALMIRGLGRKNRKTRGGERGGRREGRGERGEVGARAAREADLFGIFRRRGTKNARRLTGYDTVRRQLRHSHAARSCARQHASTPLCANCVHAWSSEFARCSPLRTLTTVIVRNFSPSSTINNPICAPDFRWKVGNF